jgi:hypothetical protein
MVDIGVALRWIALSAASAKGLSALARAVATSDAEAAALAGEGTSATDDPYWIGSSPCMSSRRRDPTLSVPAVGDRPSSSVPVDVDAASV